MNGIGTLRKEFQQHFGMAADGIWSAPGRVNLIGEHTDYNEGFVLPFAIDRAARVAVTARSDRRVRLVTTLPGTSRNTRAEADLDQLDPETATGWSAYLLGVAWAMERAGVVVPGFDLLLDSDVPVGAGLSSSAAIECAVATALNELADGALPPQELVRIGQRAENDYVGAPTGILDQSAAILSRAGSAVFLDCRSLAAELVPLELEDPALALMVIDTGVAHAHSDGAYAARRTSCELGADVLGVPALRDLGLDDLVEASGLLDDQTFRRVRHIVTENDRVLQTVEALRTTGPATIGPLLDASHASMRDDFEISCTELDLAVDSARAAGALGARMTGGGFGGSAIALTGADSVDSIRAAVLEAFAQAALRAPTVFTVRPSDGARRLD